MAQFYSPNRRVTTRQTVTVTATDLDTFGQGVARHQGKALFVPGVLPGEQAEVTLTEEKRQFAKGKLKRLLTRSEERVAPPCPHYGVCGGCQIQHAATPLQQRSKSAALLRMIARETGITPEAQPVIAGPEYGYRRRARLGLVWQPKANRLVMGFRQQGSSELVAVSRCPVLVPALEALLVPLHACLSGLAAVRRLGHVELVLAEAGPLVVLRHLDPLKEGDRARLAAFAAHHALTLFLDGGEGQLTKMCGDDPHYQVDGLSLRFSPQDFIQVNDAVNQQMVQQALAWLALTPDDRVLDLFCGMGNFTLPIARRAREVVGVEGVATLVANGQYNAQINSLNNTQFFHANLEDESTWQQWAQQGFDKVLLDPARAGAAGIMPHIAKLSPSRIVYVSCNPTTLARDSNVLLGAGYRLAEVRMLDMFPQTGHLESMALFIKPPATPGK